jgi:anaerobic selenocysteine-containing dehydrogenase
MEYRQGDHPDAVLHPLDAAPLGITDGALIEVATASGAIRLAARVTDAVAAGTVSLTHGWEGANVNLLVSSSDLDPLTGMPVLSGTAVTIRPAPSEGGSR